MNFNLEDDFQRRLYETTLDWPNFSGRVKRLLESEINGIMQTTFDLPKGAEREGEPEQLTPHEKEFNPVLQLFGRVI